jgi:hypothetical protein
VKGETEIRFELPEAAAATLTFTDVQGRTLHTIAGDYHKGVNSVNVNVSELGATGVVSYKIETVAGTATKNMIIVE